MNISYTPQELAQAPVLSDEEYAAVRDLNAGRHLRNEMLEHLLSKGLAAPLFKAEDFHATKLGLTAAMRRAVVEAGPTNTIYAAVI